VRLTVARVARVSKGFRTCRDVAQAIDVSALRYAQWEGACVGRRLHSGELERVSALLGMPIGQLADEQGRPVLAVAV